MKKFKAWLKAWLDDDEVTLILGMLFLAVGIQSLMREGAASFSGPLLVVVGPVWIIRALISMEREK